MPRSENLTVRYRRHAEYIRVLAESAREKEQRESLLRIAEEFDLLAYESIRSTWKGFVAGTPR